MDERTTKPIELRHGSAMMSQAVRELYEDPKHANAQDDIDRGTAELARSHRNAAAIIARSDEKRWAIIGYRDRGRIYLKMAAETYPAGFPQSEIEGHVKELRRAARQARVEKDNQREMALRTAAELQESYVTYGTYSFPYEEVRPIFERLREEGAEPTDLRDAASDLAEEDPAIEHMMQEAGIIPELATTGQIKFVEEAARECGIHPSVIEDIIEKMGGTAPERQRCGVPDETLDWAETELTTLGFKREHATRALLGLAQDETEEEERQRAATIA